ncbi:MULTISPECIES: hypothetical protein [unclassified Pseudomonas]|jgi:hypothetical protein|uniref:hypothetical protein n=1 Tax=unclassified Pseudomonas TaxID=196821 RepID=UPI002B23DEDA|nr:MULTISPECIES: hypothetical protein [unclassified Pseudomonas]MEA9976448.1 hypothetical protein [Pseudomonas sp. RTS4]MEB0200117.1 hypothetical protein [Pseudomonas sp. 5S4]MEB0244001.1 hypothetical protein [Pseudomonas sp. 10S5]
MFRFSESSSETNHFIFFDDYEEEKFEEFVSVVLKTLSIKEEARKFGPYSVLVSTCYEGNNLILTSGSFEGCFISLGRNASDLSKKIIERFNRVD